jgi:hypothetical protein
MANIRVVHALQKIEGGLVRVAKFIEYHHGIPDKEARAIESAASGIIQVATRIYAAASKAQGVRGTDSIITKVRKALGYTYP